MSNPVRMKPARPLKHARARALLESFIAVILLTAAACQYDPYTRDYTSRRPSASDLPGDYVVTADTRDLIHRAGTYPPCEPHVILRADHTFEVKDVPDWFITYGDAGTKLVSGTGTWQLEQVHGWWQLGVEFRESTGQSVFRGPFAMNFSLVGEKPPYLVHLTIGDPDAGNAMQFQKQ